MTESSRQTDASLSSALTAARRALARRPAGLITDFDGTLSPIVADPASAALADGADLALGTLIEQLEVVALVTGRAALDARRMTGQPGLLIVGNHGTEWLEPHEAKPISGLDAASVRERLEAVLSELPYLPGVTIEHKGLSATVHYRNAPDPASALSAISEALDGAEVRALALRRGRMSVELRPIGYGDKGSAARAICERYGLRGVLVMGDDVTDLDMFRAVADLRTGGGLDGVIVGVGTDDGELRPEVMAATDVMLGSPADAVRLLTDLAATDPPAGGG